MIGVIHTPFIYPINILDSEIEHYDFVKGESKDGNTTGHFTQLVWDSSRNLGIGVCTAGNGWTIVVGNY